MFSWSLITLLILLHTACIHTIIHRIRWCSRRTRPQSSCRPMERSGSSTRLGAFAHRCVRSLTAALFKLMETSKVIYIYLFLFFFKCLVNILDKFITSAAFASLRGQTSSPGAQPTGFLFDDTQGHPHRICTIFIIFIYIDYSLKCLFKSFFIYKWNWFSGKAGVGLYLTDADVASMVVLIGNWVLECADCCAFDTLTVTHF